MEKITTIGIDLAKNVFQIHGVNERGKAVLRKSLRRDQVTAFFANLQPCLIGMEACGSSHHWARTLELFGHTVKLMAPQFVKRYVKIKNIQQQSVLALHRVRQGFVKARTAQANQIRGLLGEFGLVVPQGIAHIAERVPALLEDASNELPAALRQLIERLTAHLKELDRQVKEFERQIIAWHRSSELSRK